MDKYQEVLTVHSVYLANEKNNHSHYVREELLKCLKNILEDVVNFNNPIKPNNLELDELISKLKISNIDVFNILPLDTYLEVGRSNNDLLALINVCLTCADKFRLDNKDFIVTAARYKAYANNHFCILVDKFKGHRMLSQCIRSADWEEELAYKIRRFFAISEEFEATKDVIILRERIIKEGIRYE